VATCANDEDIPEHMKNRLADLKVNQKKEHKNLSDIEEEEEDEKLDEDGAGADVPIVDGGEEGGGSDDDDSEDDEPPAKRLRLARVSVDAQLVQTGMVDPLFDLDAGRMSRSMSRLSRSSRASSIVSFSDSVVSS
jgi:hypothetical protein